MQDDDDELDEDAVVMGHRHRAPAVLHASGGPPGGSAGPNPFANLNDIARSANPYEEEHDNLALFHVSGRRPSVPATAKPYRSSRSCVLS